MSNTQELIKEIYMLRDKYKDSDLSALHGNEVSRDQLRLSTLLIYLGKIVSEMTRDYNKAYVFRKFSQATEYKKLRKQIDSKVKDSEMDSVLNTQKQVNDEIDKQYKADVLKTLYDDCSRLVMSLQSRLGYLRDERFNSHKGNPE